MLGRRQNARDKVIYGGVAGIGKPGAARDGVLRDISEKGANIEFASAVKLPKEKMPPTMTKKGRSLLTKIICWRDNFISVAFNPARPYELPVSDLDERVRKSEQKKQQLQRRIDDLLGGS